MTPGSGTPEPKGRVSEESFEFLAEQSILGVCEDRAAKELIAEPTVAAMQARDSTKVEKTARRRPRLRLSLQ